MPRSPVFTRVLIAAFLPLAAANAAAQGTWVVGPPMPTGRWDPACVAIGDAVYAFGGAVGGCTRTNVVQAFQPATGTWTGRAPMPMPMSAVGAGVVDGVVYLIGGEFGCGLYSAAIQAYDPVANTWNLSHPPMPGGPRQDLVVVVVNGVLYAIGGATNAFFI
jgi:hypothetical protein